MAFDKEGFKKSLWSPQNPDSASCQLYPACLEAVEAAYGWDIDAMSPAEAAAADKRLRDEADAAYNKNEQSSLSSLEKTRCLNLLKHTVGVNVSAFSAYQRFKAHVLKQRQLAEGRSNIILGALRDKMYLAPDAFPPEDYPLPQPQAA